MYAKLKGDSDIPSVGFVAHMDTSPDANDYPIIQNVIYNYDGKDIKLNDNITMKVTDYPDLLNHVGKTLITTNGETLLGADDKAGIVEIMAMLEHYKNSDEPHGDIYVAFTSDEEIGKGVEYLDRNIFKPDYAYTVDGSSVGEISFENFNAATAYIKINGVSSHTGYAKDKMINSLLIANAINDLLPKEIPANTEGKEGFYHLQEISGTVSFTKMVYLIRDFEKENFEIRKNILKEIINKLNEKYPNCIELEIKDTYKNMKQYIEKDFKVVEFAINATKKQGVECFHKLTRGGTDGVRLSERGLLCPNIGTGGHNFHSVYEYIALEDMEKVKNILIGIVNEYYLNYHKEKKLTL